MKDKTEKYTTLVRMPYNDAIRIILRTIDYHNHMMVVDKDNYYFHEKQMRRLKVWMIDMKDFIHEEENNG